MPDPTRPVAPAAPAADPDSSSFEPDSGAATAPGLDRLARTHGRLLRRMAYEVLRATGSRADGAAVDDLVQDVFCRLLERTRGIDLTSRSLPQQRAYLRRVTRSVAVDRRRMVEAAKRGGGVQIQAGLTGLPDDEEMYPPPVDSRSGPEERLLSRERWRLFARRCRRAAGGATDGQRDAQAAVLALIGGWTSRELATVSREGLSAATIDSMVCRVRRRLARRGLTLPRRGSALE